MIPQGKQDFFLVFINVYAIIQTPMGSDLMLVSKSRHKQVGGKIFIWTYVGSRRLEHTSEGAFRGPTTDPTSATCFVASTQHYAKKNECRSCSK